MRSTKLAPTHRFLLFISLCGFVGLANGCGGAGSKLETVTGKVTDAKGKPLTAGLVRYHADKEKGNTSGTMSLGEINAQGEYTLTTYGKPGTPLGHYKVTVSVDTAATADNTKPVTKSPINTTYSTPELSPITKEVVEKAAPGAYDLKIGP